MKTTAGQHCNQSQDLEGAFDPALLHADNLGQHGGMPHPGRRDAEKPRLVDGGADNGIALVLGDRQALPRDHRFVHGGTAGGDHSVNRHLLAWSNEHQVADADILDGDILLLSLTYHACGPCLEPDELAYGLARAAPRFCLRRLPTIPVCDEPTAS
jgi:hypothetical protein